MFSIGIYEILVVLLVMCVVMKPDEVPHCIEQIKKVYRYLNRMKADFSDAVEGINYVKGDDGMNYRSYMLHNGKDIEKNE